MSLPKEAEERIKADAQTWKRDRCIYTSPHHITGFIAGATAEAERSQKLMEALGKITEKYAEAEVLDDVGQAVFEMGEIAREALNEYNNPKT